jgi:hypothetical protein
MSTSTDLIRTPLPRSLALAVCAATVTGVALSARQAAFLGQDTAHTALVDAAATVDLTVVTTLVCWWMLRRAVGWGTVALIPLFFASLVLAGWVLPRGHEAPLRWMHLAAVPLELLALALVAGKVRAGRRAFRTRVADSDRWDAADAIQASAAAVLGAGRASALLAYEMSMLYYALATPRRGGEGAGAGGLTYHRKAGYGALVAALLIATAAEMGIVHLVVQRRSATLAWVLTGLAAYGALWIVADYRACRRRPLRVVDGVLRVRFGLRWSLDVPLDRIKAFRTPTAQEVATKPALDLRLALPGSSLRILELDRPVEALGMYGLRRTVRALGLGLDAPHLLAEALDARGGGSTLDRDCP